MINFLHLQEGVYLVPGKARAAIYDTNTGHVFSINQEAMDLILSASRGKIDLDNKFINDLIELNLFIWEDSEGPLIDSLYLENKTNSFEKKLNFFWAEITNRCNLNCKHCYADSGYNNTNELSEDEWKDLLNQGYMQGATSVQFIGGEPLLRNDLLSLIFHAKAIGYQKIEIFTNGTLITNKFLDQLVNIQGIQFAVSLYSDVESVHDSITGKMGSWKKTISNIEKIRIRNLSVRIAFIVMALNEDSIESTLSFCSRKGFPCPRPDIIRSSGRASTNLKPNNLELLKCFYKMCPEFYTSKEKFIFSVNYNTCWANKIAITSTGEVIPCVFARDIILGNIKSKKLSEIIDSDSVKNAWKLSKDYVQICKDCEYRYACKDCRPLAISENHNIFSKNPRCMYEPESGIWCDRCNS